MADGVPLPVIPFSEKSVLSGITDQFTARKALKSGFDTITAVKTPLSLITMGPVPRNQLFAGAQDSTNNTARIGKMYKAPALSSISDLVIVWPGSLQQSGLPDTDNLTSFTVTTAIEYPIGSTTYPVYYNGSLTGTCNSGRVPLRSDPCPIYIPAGASFRVRAFISWTGTMQFYGSRSAVTSQEWVTRGIGLTDDTQAVNTNVSTNNNGITPFLFGNLNTQIPVVGIIGDSISAGNSDVFEPDFYRETYWERGLRGQIPTLNLSTGGITAANVISRPEDRHTLWRNGITHLIYSLGRNDLNAGLTLTQMQDAIKSIIYPVMDRGVRVLVATVTPQASSTDSFVTERNQTINVNTPVQQSYNDWLRVNYASLGIQRIIDVDLAVNPKQNGTWKTPDVSKVYGVGSSSARLYATITGGAVTAVAPMQGITGLGGTTGAGFTNGLLIPLTFFPQYPDVPRRAAVGTFTISSGGFFPGGLTLSDAGAGYTLPPIVLPNTTFTADGLHPNGRGYDEIITQAGYNYSIFNFN